MNEKDLKNLIAVIDNPDYTVLWNDGYDKYILLGSHVYREEHEIRVPFQNFISKHVDLYNCDLRDFICSKKISFTKIIDEIGR